MVTATTIKKGYKQTELGVIPEDWDVKDLGQVAKFSQGVQVDLNKQLKKEQVGYIKFLRIENYTQLSDDFRYIPIERGNNKIVNEDEIVVVRYGASAGFVGIGYNGVLANNLFKVEPNPKYLNKEYLYRYMKGETTYNYFQNSMFGGAMPALSFKVVKSFIIPIPTKPEQTAIATVLSDTDALTENLEKLITKKKAIKQGAMQQLLTGKKILPGFSGEWVVSPLGKLCNYQNGTALEKYFNNRNGLLVISIGNYSEAGKFVETSSYIDRKYFKELKKFVLNKNDLTMILNDKTAVGTIIGRVLYIDENEKYIFNQRTMRLIAKDEIEPLFLYFQINSSKTHKYIVNLSKPGTQIYVNTNDITELPIAFPKSKSEQTAIATILSDMDAEIERLKEKRDKYTMLK